MAIVGCAGPEQSDSGCVVGLNEAVPSAVVNGGVHIDIAVPVSVICAIIDMTDRARRTIGIAVRSM